MSDKTQKQSQELANQLWAIANELRGSMDASKFKDYILGVIFYRYLSERTEDYMNDLLKNDGIKYRDAIKNPNYSSVINDWSIEHLGYIIEPKYLWESLISEIKDGKFSIEHFEKAISSLISSTIGQESEAAFDKLFDDMNLQDKDLGKEVSDRTNLIEKVLLKINDIPFNVNDTEMDILGTSYMILISLFASDAGKKGGEFFTPTCASKLLCRLATVGLDEVKNAADSCAGSGSLLLEVKNHLTNKRVGHFYATEKNGSNYNLLRMNLLMHGIPYKKFSCYNSDSIETDNYYENGEPIYFDIQVENPPYSAKYSQSQTLLDDPRFSANGVLPPKNRADLMFVESMTYHMSEDGRIAVLLPPGALFRGDEESKIREELINKYNYIDAVIGLPANIFHGTKTPTCIVVLKKKRNENIDNICFIDASREFKKGDKLNYLEDSHIEKIVKTYTDRKDIPQFCHVASMDEVKNNEYKLNILAFVKLNQIDKNIDAKKSLESLIELQNKEDKVKNELDNYLYQLGISTFTPENLEKALSGKIRFKNSSGLNYSEWKDTTLSDILTERKEKNTGNLRICSVAVIDGVVDQIQHLGRSYAAEDTSKYNKVCFGDVVYTKSPTGEFPFGIVKQSQMDEDVVVSPLYGVFIPKTYYLGLLLHYYFLSPANANNYLAPIIQKGAKNTINITNDTFISKSVCLPTDQEEQEKLAKFIKVFEEYVSIAREKYIALSGVEGGILHNMFC